MTPVQEPDPSSEPDDWTVDLDQQAPAAVTETELETAPVRLRRWSAAGLALALIGASVLIWGPEQEAEQKPPVATVLGSHLAVPIVLSLPADAVATADGSYVGVQFPAGGAVLVTVPTQVVGVSGAREPLPTDPAGWLSGHPGVFVSRVRPITVGTVPATQLDYRRSRMKAPPSRFARLPLFCGWRSDTGPATGPNLGSATGPNQGPAPGSAAGTSSGVCTQITADARVRATFLRIGTRTVLVEAVWRVDDSTGSGRMPREMHRSYTALLAGLTPVPQQTRG